MERQRQSGTVLISTAVILCLASFGMGFSFGALFRSGSAQPPAPQQSVPAVQPPRQGSAENGAGEIGQEIARLRQAALSSPGEARLWTRLGDACYDAGDPDGAIEAYGRSLSLEPSNADVRTDKGTMHRMRGEPEAAVRCYEEALGYVPAHKNAIFNKGITMLVDLERAAEAVRFWKDVTTAHPGFTLSNGKELSRIMPELCVVAAQELEQRGRLDAALSACAEALRLDPVFLPALTRRAWLLEKQRSPEAQSAWRAVTEASPDALDPEGKPAREHIR